jgi:hypothetical protein
MHNFTQEDLLLYLYKETSLVQTAEIKAALETDWNLREEFESLTSAQNNLKALEMSPSQRTLDAIFSYAEKAVGELSTPV